MRVEVRVVLFGMVFVGVLAIIYWFTSYEDAGTTLLVLGAGMYAILCGYLFLQSRRLRNRQPRPEDAEDPPAAEGEGEIDVEGDIFAALALRDNLPNIHLGPRQIAEATRVLGRQVLHRVPPPAEEVRLHGRRHSRQRDRAAISYHYDVSNDFYRLVLG